MHSSVIVTENIDTWLKSERLFFLYRAVLNAEQNQDTVNKGIKSQFILPHKWICAGLLVASHFECTYAEYMRKCLPNLKKKVLKS